MPSGEKLGTLLLLKLGTLLLLRERERECVCVWTQSDIMMIRDEYEDEDLGKYIENVNLYVQRNESRI